jgi:hypothetical protein
MVDGDRAIRDNNTDEGNHSRSDHTHRAGFGCGNIRSPVAGPASGRCEATHDGRRVRQFETRAGSDSRSWDHKQRNQQHLHGYLRRPTLATLSAACDAF